jgi:arylsulfatase A-like enzyme
MSILALLPLLWTLPGCVGSPPSDPDAPLSAGSDSAVDTARILDTAADTGGLADETLPRTGPALQFSGEAPTNLLFITIDTLRRDRIGRWDRTDRESATPFLDALLEESLVLEDHRSCSNWTLSSLICLLAGQSTVDLGFEPHSGDDRVADVPDDLSTAPQWLADAGFRTAAVSASPFLREGFAPTEGGFERIDYRNEGAHLYSTADWIRGVAAQRTASLRSTGEPWYLHLHYMDAHSPFDEHPTQWAQEGIEDLPPSEFDLTTYDDVQKVISSWDRMSAEVQDVLLQYMDAYYRADLRFWDEQLAQLWDVLDQQGAFDDTLVVFWTDHGEQFFDHGGYGHNQSLFGEENQTLAAFWSPGLAPGSWNGPTEHRDIFPTVLAALEGLEAPKTVTGHTLGTRPPGLARLSLRYSAPEPVKMAVDQDGWRMYYTWEGDKELYDLQTDPLEQNDLYDAENPTVHALWEPLNAEIDRMLVFMPELTPVDRGP